MPCLCEERLGVAACYLFDGLGLPAAGLPAGEPPRGLVDQVGMGVGVKQEGSGAIAKQQAPLPLQSK
ncbi:hypothetical protein NHX12_012616 [Muraenolepis orangiensis]|uniref:Uncharacterized protein n=1 Tax=Muraenolepis orangiensis TaxID=630683 RepID=A0A9Q0DEH5_9TELE|nr:hypothetical protein NHX12_012616 [Muraenolepis orangiensis]